MNHRRRVLRIIARLNVGGPAKHVSWASQGLNRIGWCNLLVYGDVESNEDDLSHFARKCGIRLLKLPTLSSSISLFKDLRCILSLYSILDRFRPLICHTHTSKAGFLGRLSVLLWRILHPFSKAPMVVHTFHGHTFHGYFSPWKHRLFLWIERLLALLGSDVIITISSQQQKEILDTYQVGNLKQHKIIPLGVETDFALELDFNSLRDSFGISSQSTVFGIVGRLSSIKNHKLFFEAIQVFQGSGDSTDVHFLIVGGGSREFETLLRDLVGSMELKNVHFTGNVEDPRQIYGALDCLVLTSINEGTPLSILEAFACGIPVIASAVGGIVDLLGVQGERGILISDPKPSEFTSQFQSITDEIPTQKVALARQFVQERYSVNRLIKDLDQLYSQLAEGEQS